MIMKKNNVKKAQTGATLVEFAIVVPLLLLLVLGIIEFGYAFYHLNILNKSVQDGARYFSDPMIARYDGTKASLTNPINLRSTNSANFTSTKNLVIYGNSAGTGTALLPDTVPTVALYCAEEPTVYTTFIPASTTTYATSACTIGTTYHIRVTATYTHTFILGNTLGNFTSGRIPNSFALTASAVLRVE